MPNVLILLAVLTLCSSLAAQQLPQTPDPNKCYVRCVSPDIYEEESRDVLTYSPEDALRYAHKFRVTKISPAREQWESTRYEGCESDNPNDCQVLCLRKYPAVYDTIYQPVLDSVGSPYYKEVRYRYLVQRGGLSSYEEIDCALTSYNRLPLQFVEGTATFLPSSDYKRILADNILHLMRTKRNLRIQINGHTSSPGDAAENQTLSQNRADAVADYLISRGVQRERLLTRGYGESQPLNRCVDGTNCSRNEHAENERVEFRVINLDG